MNTSDLDQLEQDWNSQWLLVQSAALSAGYRLPVEQPSNALSKGRGAMSQFLTQVLFWKQESSLALILENNRILATEFLWAMQLLSEDRNLRHLAFSELREFSRRSRPTLPWHTALPAPPHSSTPHGLSVYMAWTALKLRHEWGARAW